MTLSYQNLV